MGAAVGPPVVVREARPAEYDALGAMVEEAYRAGGQLDDDDGYARTLRDVADRAGTATVLAAVRGDVLLGTVTITPPGSPYSELAGPQESEFRFLAVAPPAWGSGVADLLVRACVERAAGSDIVIVTRDGNEAALRLYARHGFVRAPERDWEPVPGIVLVALVRPWSAAQS